MDRSEERKEVYAWYGGASYHAQCMEVELIIARAFLIRGENEDLTGEELEAVIHPRKTMGNLIRDIKARIELDVGEQALFTECLEIRNFLAHRYWYERSALLWSSSGCKEAVAELEELSSKLEDGDAAAGVLSRRVRASLGLSEEFVTRMTEEYIAELARGETSEETLQRQQEYLRNLGRE